jgi:hypothetical protein
MPDALSREIRKTFFTTEAQRITEKARLKFGGLFRFRV